MKTLILLRHAKSSWKFPELTDFDRPLNERGMRDAPIMGKLLSQQNFHFDVFISSTANRALSTSNLFALELGFPLEKIVLSEEIYEASPNKLLQIIKGLDENIGTAILVGHDSGITDLAHWISDAKIRNIPTCGVLGLEFDSKWTEIRKKSGKMKFFEYPKKNKAKLPQK